MRGPKRLKLTATIVWMAPMQAEQTGIVGETGRECELCSWRESRKKKKKFEEAIKAIYL
jgi:hypothetical protein